MTAKNQKVKDEKLQAPVEETTEPTEPTENPVEPTEETASTEPEESAENLDETPTPANEEISSEGESADADLEHDAEPEEPKTEAPVEEKPAEEPKKEEKKGKVEVKEPEYKYFDTIKAPAEIKKIIDFYGITSRDLFDGSFEKMKLKKEEVKALKEWYATLI